MSDLPKGWEKATLGELLHLVNGYAFKPSDWGQEGLPIIRIQNLNNPDAKFNRCRFELPEKFLVNPGELLFAWSGTPGTSFGAHIWRGGKAWLNQHIFKVVFDQASLNKSYLRFAINQNLDEYVAAARGGSGLAHITKGQFESSEIPVPPFAEQHRIVAEIEKQFTRLDAAVASLRRVQANLKRYRAAVLKAACEGRLVETEAAQARAEQRPYEPAAELLQRTLRERRARWEADQLAKMEAAGKPPKDDQWKAKYDEPAAPDTSTLRQLPEGWAWCSLRMIAELKGGITKGQKRQPSEKLRSVPYLRVANVQRGFFDLREIKNIEATEDEIEELRLLIGDILFNEGGDRDKLGRGWVWQGEIADCIHQNHIFRARLFLAEMPPKYVSHYGNSEAQNYFLAQAKQTTNLASINMSKLGALPVPLPPLAEQDRIVEELERRLSIIDGLERSLETSLQRAATLRQKVLQDAFTGKLVEQDKHDEPASKLLERIKTERVRREAEEQKKRKEERKAVKKTGKTATGERRKLVEVLREAERPLAPEVLFREAGFKPEDVEAFYDELKQADKDELITEDKRPNGNVYLSARA